MDPTSTTSDGSPERGDLPASPDLIGTILAGRYRVMSKLGSGGMGDVYVAEHRLLGAHFALKTLSPRLRDSEIAEQRFRQEAELGAELCHPHLVRVFDYETAGPTPFFVMELLQGQDLRRLLGSGQALSIGRGVRLMRGALAGLAAAHARGIVHRDLKPSNLFVVDPGPHEQCKVLDFGVARVESSPAAATDPLTQGDKPLGTLAYMAPEQIRDPSAVDARADVYSACAILLEALSGEQRFDAEGARERIFRILNEPAPRLDAPRALADIVARGLSREREARPRDAAALAEALREFAGVDLAPSANRAPKASGFGARELLLLAFGTAAGGMAVQLGHSASVRSAGGEAPKSSAPELTASSRAAAAAVSEPASAQPRPSEPRVGDVAAMASSGTAGARPVRSPRSAAAASASALPAPLTKPAIGLERANPYE
jgi:serine/threonine-protein kinase